LALEPHFEATIEKEPDRATMAHLISHEIYFVADEKSVIS
jgi:hypothetical protein